MPNITTLGAGSTVFARQLILPMCAKNLDILMKYGVNQCSGDTIGPGGISRTPRDYKGVRV